MSNQQKKLVSEEEFDYMTKYLGLPYKTICLKLVALCQQRHEEYIGGNQNEKDNSKNGKGFC
ncbi:MAG: hypothetical protein AABY22_14375 [Nanoarchaeota archaeon]